MTDAFSNTGKRKRNRDECSFDKFTNPLGQKYNNEKIKGLCFRLQRELSSFQSFAVSVPS
jgi:hypothetical protein